jgi:hypothetical protein
MDQAGLTFMGGMPVPNGLGFYNYREKMTQMAETSRPSTVRGPDILIQGKKVAVIGSQIIGDQIKIDSEDTLEIRPAVLRLETHTEIEDDSISFSFSGKKGGGVSSVTVTFGGGRGYIDGSGHNLAYSYIGGGGELATTVNINVENGVMVASPIEANTINIKAGNLLVETLQEVWNERSSYIGWSAGLTFVAGSPYPIPSGSYSQSFGSGDRRWAEVPALIKGNDVYVDLEGECKLVGGGILGKNITLNAQSLDWLDVYSKDKSRSESFGVVIDPIGKLGSGRASSPFSGFVSYSQSGSDQERITRATISENANINLKDQKDLSSLNRDESRMVETSAKDEYTYSIGVPLVNVKELKERVKNGWVLRQREIEQKIDNKNLPAHERGFLEAEREIIEAVKDEAIEQGLASEDVADVVQDLTDQHYVAKNLEKLIELHGGGEIEVEQVIEVFEGKDPVKDKDGKVSFREGSERFGGVIPQGDTAADGKREWSFWRAYVEGLRELEQAEAGVIPDHIDPDTKARILSMRLDANPVTGIPKSVIELAAGKDYIVGEEVDRRLLALALLAPVA